jgi:hypothetical protein
MMATIRTIANDEHVARVLVERMRRDRVDPLWRSEVMANAFGTALSSLRDEARSGLHPSGFNRLSQENAS